MLHRFSEISETGHQPSSVFRKSKGHFSQKDDYIIMPKQLLIITA